MVDMGALHPDQLGFMKPKLQLIDADPEYNPDLGLWELAAGKGSKASKESARLLIGYLAVIGLVSVVSPMATWIIGICGLCVPYYHFTLTATSQGNIVKRSISFSKSQGMSMYVVVRDSTLREIELCSLDLRNGCDRLTSLIGSVVSAQVVTTRDAYRVYAKLVCDAALVFVKNESGYVLRKRPNRALPKRVCRENVSVRKVRMMRKRLGVCRMIVKVCQGLLRWFYITEEFAGSDRMALLGKIVHDETLSDKDVLTLAHDVALMNGERLSVLGKTFDGSVNRADRMLLLEHSFNLTTWARQHGFYWKAPDEGDSAMLISVEKQMMHG